MIAKCFTVYHPQIARLSVDESVRRDNSGQTADPFDDRCCPGRTALRPTCGLRGFIAFTTPGVLRQLSDGGVQLRTHIGTDRRADPTRWGFPPRQQRLLIQDAVASDEALYDSRWHSRNGPLQDSHVASPTG